MDLVNILIGVLLYVLGFFLIKYYLLLVKENKHGGLSINLILQSQILFVILISKEGVLHEQYQEAAKRKEAHAN